MDDFPQIEDPIRRKLILDESYYEFYQLKTPQEAAHPFGAVLALESENHHKYSLLRSRIKRYADLDVGSMGISLTELLNFPREIVEEIFNEATEIKASKTKTAARAVAEFENGLGVNQK